MIPTFYLTSSTEEHNNFTSEPNSFGYVCMEQSYRCLPFLRINQQGEIYELPFTAEQIKMNTILETEKLENERAQENYFRAQEDYFRAQEEYKRALKDKKQLLEERKKRKVLRDIQRNEKWHSNQAWIALHGKKPRIHKPLDKDQPLSDTNQPCSVCWENTTRTTFCNHILCMSCWSQLKDKSCPMCRSRVFRLRSKNERI